MNWWFNLSYHDFKIVLGVILIAIYVAATVYKWRTK